MVNMSISAGYKWLLMLSAVHQNDLDPHEKAEGQLAEWFCCMWKYSSKFTANL